MNGSILQILMIVGLIAAGISSRFIFKSKPDNEFEQAIEKVIKEKTGMDIDLSPDVNNKKEAKKD